MKWLAARRKLNKKWLNRPDKLILNDPMKQNRPYAYDSPYTTFGGAPYKGGSSEDQYGSGLNEGISMDPQKNVGLGLG